ncbi:hypothetical protein AALO_G00000950 [Alosa alosa]|uniref:Uncharacterized protein n=1 Tax=Alosa alosa TaxID=278164 RepID=A0AAV6HH02_9TELE|nr:hypothetical protein AALO_G00000950 [Alosa alosa]
MEESLYPRAFSLNLSPEASLSGTGDRRSASLRAVPQLRPGELALVLKFQGSCHITTKITSPHLEFTGRFYSGLPSPLVGALEPATATSTARQSDREREWRECST